VRTDVDPAVTSRLLFGAVNSLTEWYRPDGGLGPPEVGDALVAITFRGLRTSPAEDRPSRPRGATSAAVS
jgi:Tetracyclin repressor-like, C-terminal domain